MFGEREASGLTTYAFHQGLKSAVNTVENGFISILIERLHSETRDSVLWLWRISGLVEVQGEIRTIWEYCPT